jgi:integrase
MQSLRLNDAVVRSLPVPGKGQRSYFDESLPCFGCRVSQGGTRSFIVMHGPERSIKTIGRYPVITLAEARAEAKRILAQRTLEKFRPQAIRWDEAVVAYLTECEQKNRLKTVRGYRYLLGLFEFGRRGLADIAPQELHRVIDRFGNRPALKNAVAVCIRTFFNWAERRHYVDRTPCARMKRPRAKPSRSRVLTDDELRRVWTAASECGSFGDIVRLLVLSGQRRGEIAALRPGYVKDGLCSLPASLTKNGRDHCFPLSETAVSILGPRIALALQSNAPFLFPALGRPDASFSGWSKSKWHLDRLSGVSGWVLHDLRRTFATNLAALGTPIQVTERLLNHVSGSQSGIIAVYQRHTFMPEMRIAVSAWENRLSEILREPI